MLAVNLKALHSIFLIFSTFLWGCHTGHDRAAQRSFSGYNLGNPSDKWLLHHDLDEISGLSYVKKGVIAAIEDETGYIYLVSTKNGNIIRKIKFAKGGDYEGVELMDGTVFIIRSDGRLYRTSLTSQSDNSEEIAINNLPFKSANDVEGLGKNRSLLLIACKGEGSINKNKAKGKAIYAYDPKNNQLIETPWVTITKKDLQKFSEAHLGGVDLPNFKPSAIATHPHSGHVFLLSHSGKMILALDQNRNIKAMASLDKKIFKQPEGICFDKKGNLYIANEAQGGRAHLLRFQYHGKP